MKLLVRLKDLNETKELREQVERRLGFALDRFEDRLSEVAVSFSDANGPRGGLDKLCRLHATLTAGPVISIEEKGEDQSAVLNSAAKRLAHSVGRELQRMQRPVQRRGSLRPELAHLNSQAS